VWRVLKVHKLSAKYSFSSSSQPPFHAVNTGNSRVTQNSEAK